jgi:tRNA(fMet)-specific endonuclease VapC
MQYLLDTNICIYIAKRKPASVSSRLKRLRPGDVGMSVITYLELVYGACKSARVSENLAAIDLLERLIPAQPMDSTIARQYGELRTSLEQRGLPIGPHDLLIAAHALSLNVILVTSNTREFSRVEGLRLKDWTK